MKYCVAMWFDAIQSVLVRQVAFHNHQDTVGLSFRCGFTKNIQLFFWRISTKHFSLVARSHIRVLFPFNFCAVS